MPLKSEIQRASLEFLQHKSTIGMGIAGGTTIAASLLDKVESHLSFISFCFMVVFGIVNIVINYKRYKIDAIKKTKNEES